MPFLIQCDGAMSDAVLQAARAAIPTTFSEWSIERRWIDQLPEKQRPLVPLLMALLDSAQAVAKAIGDNAWDDNQPLSKELTKGLSNQASRIGSDIINSSDCPDASNWSLPSMSGKEFV